MALISPRVIARVNSSSASELAVMSFEWIMRADGQVLYRLTKVDGRGERNPWSVVTQLAPAELEAFRSPYHPRGVSWPSQRAARLH
jgi:hypothetical protein